MSDLYLIAHKVYGEPAFDVAVQIECPICVGTGRGDFEHGAWCVECDSLGFWWIIATSGHRAYPYWNSSLDDLAVAQGNLEYYSVSSECPDMPPSIPDHYPAQSHTRPKLDLTSLLAPAKIKIQRRF